MALTQRAPLMQYWNRSYYSTWEKSSIRFRRQYLCLLLSAGSFHVFNQYMSFCTRQFKTLLRFQPFFHLFYFISLMIYMCSVFILWSLLIEKNHQGVRELSCFVYEDCCQLTIASPSLAHCNIFPKGNIRHCVEDVIDKDWFWKLQFTNYYVLVF